MRYAVDHDQARRHLTTYCRAACRPTTSALIQRLPTTIAPDRYVAHRSHVEGYEGFEAAGDGDSLALLLAWLDRSGKARAEPAPADRAMTEAEAYRVLGLAPGASLEEVRAAYRRLMKRVHPDLGGSGALAAMLNAAKEVLDPG